MALVYGDFGLGKSQTIQWWAFRNNSIYVRATKGMTSKWLLSEILEELGEDTYWNSQEIFENIEHNLVQCDSCCCFINNFIITSSMVFQSIYFYFIWYIYLENVILCVLAH